MSAGIQAKKSFGEQCALYGNELVSEVHRMAQMNLHLHRLDASLKNNNTLSMPLGQSHLHSMSNESTIRHKKRP